MSKNPYLLISPGILRGIMRSPNPSTLDEKYIYWPELIQKYTLLFGEQERQLDPNMLVKLLNAGLGGLACPELQPPVLQKVEILLTQILTLRNLWIQESKFEACTLTGSLEQCDLHHSTFSDLIITYSAVIRDTNMQCCNLYSVVANDCLFENTSLDSAVFEHGVFTYCNFKNCSLTNITFLKTAFRDCRFRNCDVTGANWETTLLVQTSKFHNCAGSP